MIVREIRLENIKSYGSPPEVIKFTRGVNAICGPNGAGKSTVLEAIGSALFQHLPYKHEEFVRSGEVSGTITVVVESRRDGRVYEVIRKVGRGGTHYVFDPDVQQQIARGDANVGYWLRQHFDLDETVDLRSLFLDAVGPPQGTLTAAFLESPQVRQAKFNRLLRVDEYTEAFRRLSALETALKEEQEQRTNELAGLNGQLSIRPDRELRHQVVRAEQADLALRLSRSVNERSLLDHLLAEFEQAGVAWRTAKAELDLATLRAQHARDRRDTAARDHAAAQAAADTCASTKAAHDAYRGLDDQARALDADRHTRDGWRTQQNKLQLQIGRGEERLARLDQEIERLARALAEAADLQSRIPEQEAAEERLQQARSARLKREQLQQNLSSLKQQLDRIAKSGNWVKAEIERITALQPLAADRANRRARYEEAFRALTAANQADGELRTLRQTIQREKGQLSALREKISGLNQRIMAATTSDVPTEPMMALETRLREVTEARAGASSHLEHARQTRQQVGGGLCPFLHEPCRNLRPGVDLATYFDQEVAHWEGEVERVARVYFDTDRAVQLARRFADQQSKINEWIQQRGIFEQNVREIAEHLAVAEPRLKDVAALASSRTEIERQEGVARDALQAAERAEQEIHRLPELNTELRERREDWERQKAEIDATREHVAALDGVDEELRTAEESLRSIGGPRERAAQLRVEAEPLPNRRADRQHVASRIETDRDELRRIDQSLRPFQDLDARIDALRQRREELHPDYETYLSAAALAGTLEQHTLLLAGAEATWREAEAARAGAEQGLASAAAHYNAAAHQTRQQQRDQIDQTISETQARIAANSEEEQRIRAELARLDELTTQRDALEQRLAAIDDERQVSTVIRQAIRAAGPEITKRLLQGISRTASQINGEILNQAGLEIEWSPNFEITTRHQGKERNFTQLSGGEQMAAALAVRLALLRELSNVRVAFLDEPTAHLDQERRSNLGDQVQRLRGFDQIVVISHDDTFDGLFGHVVRIGREDGRSRVIEPG